MYLRLFLLLPLLLAVPAHAKNASWWDCFFAEFERCQASSDGEGDESPEQKSSPGAHKSFCDGKARATCEEKERANEVKLDTRSANDTKGKANGASTIQLEGSPARPSRPEDALTNAAAVVVEGVAPSGDHAVLGIDVTLAISQVADAYPDRHVHGCRPLEDAWTRTLCVDPPGGGSPSVKLDFYRGRLTGLAYDADGGAVKFRAAVAVAEDKTGARATLSSQLPDAATRPRPRACYARFALGNGTMLLSGSGSDAKEPCLGAALDGAGLVRVEWFPSVAVQRELEEQRKADKTPFKQKEKREELEKAKQALPL